MHHWYLVITKLQHLERKQQKKIFHEVGCTKFKFNLFLQLFQGAYPARSTRNVYKLKKKISFVNEKVFDVKG